nr:MAG TPA: hypothetical protein [Inoviridae sp.]
MVCIIFLIHNLHYINSFVFVFFCFCITFKTLSNRSFFLERAGKLA